MARRAAAALALCIAACTNDVEYTSNVLVFEGERCVVNGTTMPCANVGAYLRDTLKLPPDRGVSISIEGTQNSDALSTLVREILRGAGYTQTRVIRVGFLTEPPGDRAAQPVRNPSGN